MEKSLYDMLFSSFQMQDSLFHIVPDDSQIRAYSVHLVTLKTLKNAPSKYMYIMHTHRLINN